MNQILRNSHHHTYIASRPQFQHLSRYLLTLALAWALTSTAPLEAHYRDPVLTLSESSRKDLTAALGKDGTVFEEADRGDQVRAVVKLSAPPSFRAGTGVTVALTASITFSSTRGGTAKAMLRSNWMSGIAMLLTPDNKNSPEQAIIDTVEFVLPPGGSQTRTLTVGVQFAPTPGWSDENGSAVYLVGRAGGRWDTGAGEPPNPQYQALLRSYSAGKMHLGGGFDLDFSVGAASVYDHVNYNYEGVALYYDEEAPPAPPTPPAPPKPAPPKPTPAVDRTQDQADADAARAKDYERYGKFFGKIIRADWDLQDDTLKLRLYGQAVEQLRERIRKLKQAAKDPHLYAVAREEAAEQVTTLEGQLAAILKAQDDLIAKTLTRYQALLEEAGVNKHNAACGYTRDGYERYRQELEERLERMELELRFSAGQREKFDAVARDMIARHVQPTYVYRLRAADYIARGQPRAALYALQKGLAITPQDVESKLLLWQLEDGYLRALAARAGGRPAELRARLEAAFNGRGEPGWFNAIKDVLTTGITSSVSAIGGKPESLTDLAATSADEAVVEHAGLQLILSLRYHGLSLQEISQLNQDQLWIVLLDRYRIDPTKYNKHDDLLRMRKAIHMALQNQDVQRLMHPSTEQMALDTGAGADDGLDRTWQDHIGDAVNVANTMMLLGPSAVIGTPGRAARLVRGASAELPEAYTLSDGFALALRLDEVAITLGKTNAGRAALKELLLFDKNAGVISKFIAQTMVKQGLIQGADYLGGQPAKVAMQVLTALGLGDMKAAAQLLRSQGLNEKNVETLLGQLQKAAADTVKVRVPLADTVKIVQQAAKPTVKLSQQDADSLRAAGQEMGQRAKETLKITAQGPPNSPAIVEANKQRLAQEALEEAAAGRPASANASLALLHDLEQRSAVQSLATAQQREVGEKLMAALKSQPAPAARPTGYPPQVDAKRLAAVVFEPAVSSGYTGLIVNCRGQGVVRAFFPEIIDTAGTVIYGAFDEKELDSDTLVSEGKVVYYDSLEKARSSGRAGANPLVITAVGSSGPIRGDHNYAVVSLEDGHRILAENTKSGFLKTWKVCFVVD